MFTDHQPDDFVNGEYISHLKAASRDPDLQDADWTWLTARPINPLHTVYVYTCTAPQGVYLGTLHADYDELDVHIYGPLPLPLPKTQHTIPERITSR